MNLNGLFEYFKKIDIKDEILNELYYYSLFDSSTFEDEDFWPSLMVEDSSKNTRALLRKVCNIKGDIWQYLKDQETFRKFEVNFIANDGLSRVLLAKKLSDMGLRTKLNRKYDLYLPKNNINIELKRICLWTNYTEYFTSFLNKIDHNNHMYIVTCTHPFIIEKMIPEKSNVNVFNKYIYNIIRSHYIIEKLMEKPNVKFVIGFVNKEGSENYNINGLCKEIAEKIDSRWN